jgi:phage gpG-like protein
VATVQKVGDWDKARHLLNVAPKKLRAAADKGFRQEAQLLRRIIVQGITEQNPGGKKFEKLSPLTMATRRMRVDRKGKTRSKALMVRGDLRNSITVVQKPKSAFIGVPRAARSRDGKQLVSVAAVHEFGSPPIVIPITPKMRRFLFAMFRRAGVAPRTRGSVAGGSGFVVVTIPARPFLRPSFKKFQRNAASRFQKRVAMLLDGDYGV